MKVPDKTLLIVIAIVASVVFSSAGFAQTEDPKKDKTGTNPIKFQRELRFYDEFTWLNTAGDGTANVTTMEFRTPIFGGKWQWRARARFRPVSNSLTRLGNRTTS